MTKKDRKKLVKQYRALDKECRVLGKQSNEIHKRFIFLNEEKCAIKQRLEKDLNDKLFKP